MITSLHAVYKTCIIAVYWSVALGKHHLELCTLNAAVFGISAPVNSCTRYKHWLSSMFSLNLFCMSTFGVNGSAFYGPGALPRAKFVSNSGDDNLWWVPSHPL